jgi:2-keto-3-deoxy-L-fuconate dehydrogenase
MFSLHNKIALVAGGASGIGAAIATAFRSQGATVTIADLDPSADLPLDVTSPESVRQLFDQFPRLDILVNSFGIMHVGRIHETSIEDYDRVQSVNARGVFLCAKAAIEIMRPQGHGNIINLASVAGLIAVERRFAYCVSKGAVVELSRALAIDYARENIRVNAICPGTIDTPMIRNYVQAHFGDRVAETIAELHARQPVGRMGTAEEIAAFAVYLASDESRYLTGAALPIDGGWTAK